MTIDPRIRRGRKRHAALQALQNLWPNGVPTTIGPHDLTNQVRHWLQEHCEEFPNLTISRETILRAAGRKTDR
jgi:hypothetical protein